jgi:hypothetical protein
LLVTAGRPPRPSTSPTIGIAVAKVATGVLLVGFGLYRHRHPRPAVGPPKWAAGLARLRHSLEAHRGGVVVVIAAVVGLWLLGNGLSTIVSS